jgi:hypothetical protein
MLKILGAIPAIAFLSFQIYWGVIVPRQFEAGMSEARAEVMNQVVRNSIAMSSDAEDAVVMPSGVDDEKARKEVEAYAARFSPTQNCTQDMLYDARSKLNTLTSGNSLSTQAKYRLWVHKSAIALYEEKNQRKVNEMRRAYGARDAVSPVECEKYVVGLAIARRG